MPPTGAHIVGGHLGQTATGGGSSYETHSLRDQVVLVTGASSGIGEATALRFAEEGCKLIICARRTDRLNELKKKLVEQYEVPVHTATLDVTDSAKLDEFCSQLPPEFKEVDILVNNAGLALGTAPVQENSVEDAMTMINTNCTSVVLVTRHFAPGMVERNRGHIINISSIAGHYGYPGGSIYCGTKHFVRAFTDAARHDLVGTDVRVTAISPGAVQTEFSNIRFKGDGAKADAVYDGMIPLTAQDVADSVLYAATRPAHVQIGDIILYASYQASSFSVARPLKDKQFSSLDQLAKQTSQK
ncbi:hypothetical protein WJX73_010866 [Symbiochloris irregularis]|uniref:Uncharacterized protein n=1 Tax=Symbiochloris irregularis TaxID=706552 RepID=A0AAW1P8F3_9CHLO